jgi:hypothetical protein
MLYDLLLILAAIAVVLSPSLIDAWTYREPRMQRTARHRTWIADMTS